jgi:large subunit ribosomal protein L9
MHRVQRLVQQLQSASVQLVQQRTAKASPAKLPVELLQDIEGLASAGNRIQVSHGFARNWLVPKRLAKPKPADPSTRRLRPTKAQLAAQEASEQVAVATSASLPSKQQPQSKAPEQSETEQLRHIVNVLTKKPVKIKRKAAEDGDLAQPIDADDVVDAVAKQLRIDMVPELLRMPEPLTATGQWTVPLEIRLANGDQAVLQVEVAKT